MYKVQEKRSQFNFGHFSVGRVWNPLHMCWRQAGLIYNKHLETSELKKNLEMRGIFQGCNRVQRKNDVGVKLNYIICGNL